MYIISQTWLHLRIKQPNLNLLQPTIRVIQRRGDATKKNLPSEERKKRKVKSVTCGGEDHCPLSEESVIVRSCSLGHVHQPPRQCHQLHHLCHVHALVQRSLGVMMSGG